jgi:hypothetical protein
MRIHADPVPQPCSKASSKLLKDVLLVQVKNLLEPLYCTLLQAPAGGPTDQPFTNKAGSTEDRSVPDT